MKGQWFPVQLSRESWEMVVVAIKGAIMADQEKGAEGAPMWRATMNQIARDIEAQKPDVK